MWIHFAFLLSQKYHPNLLVTPNCTSDTPIISLSGDKCINEDTCRQIDHAKINYATGACYCLPGYSVNQAKTGCELAACPPDSPIRALNGFDCISEGSCERITGAHVDSATHTCQCTSDYLLTKEKTSCYPKECKGKTTIRALNGYDCISEKDCSSKTGAYVNSSLGKCQCSYGYSLKDEKDGCYVTHCSGKKPVRALDGYDCISTEQCESIDYAEVSEYNFKCVCFPGYSVAPDKKNCALTFCQGKTSIRAINAFDCISSDACYAIPGAAVDLHSNTCNCSDGYIINSAKTGCALIPSSPTTSDTGYDRQKVAYIIIISCVFISILILVIAIIVLKFKENKTVEDALI